MTARSNITYRGIDLRLNWQDGGLRVEDLPELPGVYAEIYRPLAGVRIGETGRSMWSGTLGLDRITQRI